MAKAGQTPKAFGSPRMQQAWDLYDAGDVKRAREQARALLRSPDAPEDEAQARELLGRTEMPRPVWVMAAVALVLLITLIALGVARS